MAPFGKAAKELFLFDPSYRSLNHGSFGAIPRAMRDKLREYQDLVEARPDPFIRYDYPKLLDESRAAAAELLHAPVDTVVFVANATVGTNAVLRNLQWDDDCKDEILYFNSVYGALGKTVDYIVDSRYGRVSARPIELIYPCEDEEVVAAFHAAVEASRKAGKRPRVCVIDIVSSLPGLVVPYQALVAACRELGILSLVDGAQGIGLVDLNLSELDPDFFVTNCHKWLHVPRSCAVFYVPARNQDLVSSTVPTSHGYIAKSGARFNPLPPSDKPQFVQNFEFIGTLDNSPFLCVKDAIQWRKDTFGGEAKIHEYQRNLAKEGGRRVAQILGTRIMENSKGTLTNCGMVTIALPLRIGRDPALSGSSAEPEPQDFPVIPFEEAPAMTQWLQEALVEHYNTFIPIFAYYRNEWWARLSAQVYLDMDDFEWAAYALKDICERATTRSRRKSKL